MRGIVLAPDLTLPIEAVTETFAIVAKRGVGKSTTGRKMAEGMVAAGCQVVVLDPVDKWWGLRSSADGKGEGLPIYIFGGEHGDVPLEDTAGRLMAEAVVEYGFNAIFALRHFSEKAKQRFVADFAERLYELKGEAKNRGPLHLFIDEADEFAPQRLQPGQGRMFGAIDRLVRRGRADGIGVSLISQRPQVINKDVLTQCEILIALRLIHKLDRKNVDEWVQAHDVDDKRDTFMSSLASLAIGEAWVWSPGWLGIFQRVQLDMPWTFDSSYTPKPGERRIEPSSRVEVDLAALGERIAATREQVKATDPKHLQARVRELEREVETYRAADYTSLATNAEAARLEELGQVAAANDALVNRNHELIEAGVIAMRLLRDALEPLETALMRAKSEAVQPARARLAAKAAKPEALYSPPKVAATTPARAARTPDGDPSSSVVLPAGARRMLATLSAFPGRALTRQQLGVLADVSSRGGTFGDYLSKLRVAGYLDEPGAGQVRATDAGRAVAEAAPIGSTEELIAIYRAKFPAGARRMLDALVEAYPRALNRAELGERAEVSPAGGTFGDYLSKLRVVGLIDERDGIRLGDIVFMFEGGR